MFQFLKKRSEEPRWKEVKQVDDSMKDEESSIEGSTDGLLGPKPPASRWLPRNYKTTIVYLLLGLNLLWTIANLATFWSQHPFELNHKLRQISTPCKSPPQQAPT